MKNSALSIFAVSNMLKMQPFLLCIYDVLTRTYINVSWIWTWQVYTLAVSSAFTLLAFTRTILKGLDTSHTDVCTCCRGEGTNNASCKNTHSHMLLFQHPAAPCTPAEQTRCGGCTAHSGVGWICGGPQEKHHMMLPSQHD